jgi:hypothetical protein
LQSGHACGDSPAWAGQAEPAACEAGVIPRRAGSAITLRNEARSGFHVYIE